MRMEYELQRRRLEVDKWGKVHDLTAQASV